MNLTTYEGVCHNTCGRFCVLWLVCFNFVCVGDDFVVVRIWLLFDSAIFIGLFRRIRHIF